MYHVLSMRDEREYDACDERAEVPEFRQAFEMDKHEWYSADPRTQSTEVYGSFGRASVSISLVAGKSL